MSDTEEPKKPTETKKSMGAPSAPSSSQSSKSSADISSGLENITKKLDEIKTADQSQRAELKKGIDNLAGSLSKDKPTKEEENEKKKSFSKAFQKLGDTIKKSFGGLKNFGALLSGALGPLKKFWDAVKKVKGFILAFLGVFLLKTFTIKDVKQMWEGMKKFFLETKRLFITIMEFMEPIVDWFKKRFAPATFTLFMDTLDNLTATFALLTADFKDFTQKGWKDKMSAIITALGTVGTFVTNFFGDVIDWTARLLGYDGSVTKNIKDYLTNVFGPDIMDRFTSTLMVLVGAMAVARVFGMSPVKFMRIASSMIWGSIRALFAVVRLALSPVGLGLTLAALTITFSKEIVKAIENTVGQLVTGFKNMFIDLNNSIADTAVGKLAGFKKKDKLVWDTTVEAEKYQAKEQKGIAELEATIKRQELHKSLSALPGARGAAELKQGGFDSAFDDDAQLTKNKHLLERKQNSLKEFQYNWSEELKIKDAKSPSALKNWTEEKLGDIMGTGTGDTLDAARNAEKPYPMTLHKSPDLTKGFEGFGKVGRPGFSYLDTKDNRTIGYGFNMDKPNAESIMKKAGINKDWDDLYAGRIALTKQEGTKLKDFEQGYFRESAKNWIGVDKWTKMNAGAQNALTDMAYNMGGQFTGKKKDGTFKWTDLRTALRSGDMAGVGPAIRDSNYFKDVQGERSGTNIAALSNAYARPSPMYNHDLSPTKERIAQEPPIQLANNTNTVNEGDSFLADGQKHRSGENKLSNKIVMRNSLIM